MATIFKPSIRTYLILMNLILLFFLFPSSTLLLLRQEAKNQKIELERDLKQIRENLKSRRATLTRNMALSASQAIAGYDFSFLNILVDQIVKDDPEISYCIIMTRDKLVVAHSLKEKIGSVLDNETDQFISKTLYRFPEKTDKKKFDVTFIDTASEVENSKTCIIESFAPIYNGNKLWGALRLGFSTASIQDEIQTARANWIRKVNQYKYFLLTTIGIFLSIGILVAALFTRLLVRPVSILSQGVVRISEGDLEHTIGNQGLIFKEFTELSGAFNMMQKKLKDSYSKLEEYNRFLENKVEERTKELKEAQKNLLQQAHEAGMAEMSVGIIHNIGNAITPAKAGASLIEKNLRRSPVRKGFQAAADQIVSAIETSRLPDENEKERLCRIVKLLPESITEQYNHTIQEIKKIQETHEHIDNIIRLQMQYGAFGDYEKTDLREIIEDALKLLNDSIIKRRIQVVKHFSEIPDIRVQKTKLIQIFVNLIKNAIESMDDTPEKNKIITLKLKFNPTPPGYIEFTIRDTGCGFTEEEKIKLFRFGYTTKTKGSGFGLHSCANYLIANNGYISAESEGKGKGAQFSIRLPKEEHIGNRNIDENLT